VAAGNKLSVLSLGSVCQVSLAIRLGKYASSMLLALQGGTQMHGIICQPLELDRKLAMDSRHCSLSSKCRKREWRLGVGGVSMRLKQAMQGKAGKGVKTTKGCHEVQVVKGKACRTEA
jgi:hypothetical protein